MKRVVWFLLFVVCPLWAQTPADLPELLAALDGPVTLQTAQGTDITGSVTAVSPQAITLTQQVGVGSVEYTYAKEDVFRVHLPGTGNVELAQAWLATGETEAGLTLLQAVFKQRAPFFPYLPPAEPPVFLALVEALNRQERGAEALAVGLQIEPWLQTEAAQRRWQDGRLLATYFAGMYAEARALADAWIARQDRYADSALGWGIAASLARKRGEPKASLELAMHPIVFSTNNRLPFLAHAYAMAIMAAVELEEYALARSLEAEMTTRDLTWPPVIDRIEIPASEEEGVDE